MTPKIAAFAPMPEGERERNRRGEPGRTAHHPQRKPDVVPDGIQ